MEFNRESKFSERVEPADPPSLERQVRQLLADKIAGNQVGPWLLVPEHLRLGTWDLLCGWSGAQPQELEPRLALQIVHKAALCRANLRCGRTTSTCPKNSKPRGSTRPSPGSTDSSWISVSNNPSTRARSRSPINIP